MNVSYNIRLLGVKFWLQMEICRRQWRIQNQTRSDLGSEPLGGRQGLKIALGYIYSNYEVSSWS